MEIKAGAYRLTAFSQNKVRVEGRLRLYSGSPTSPHTQWWARLKDKGAGLNNVLSRLGMHPIKLELTFEERLRNKEPLALLFDTNAFSHGGMLQIIQARSHRHLYAALADQTFMEIQRQRETSLSGSKPHKAPSRARALGYLPQMNLKRIKRQGHPIHFVRPPDALVRYFGLGAAGGNGERGAGPGYHRDRMIIEAARQLKAFLGATAQGQLPMALVTHDINMALQANLEGFDVHMFECPQLEDRKTFISSPWIGVRSRCIHMLSLEEVLTELIVFYGHVQLVDESSKVEINFKIREGRREVARGLMLPGSYKCYTVRTRSDTKVQDKASPQNPSDLPGNTAGEVQDDALGRVSVDDATISDTSATAVALSPLPIRPPSAKSLILGLLDNSEPDERCILYHLHLGWRKFRPGCSEYTASHTDITLSGKVLSSTWPMIESQGAPLWCSWVNKVEKDLRVLPWVSRILEHLKSVGTSESEEELAEAVGLGQKTLERWLRLLGQLDVLARRDGRVSLPRHKGKELEYMLLKGLKHLAEKTGSVEPVVSVEALDAYVYQHNNGVLLHDLSGACRALIAGKQIMAVGDSPRTTNARYRVLLPSEGGASTATVDLGHGDFLVAGEPMQDITLVYGGI